MRVLHFGVTEGVIGGFTLAEGVLVVGIIRENESGRENE